MPDVDVKSVLIVKDFAGLTRARNARAKELLLIKTKLEAEQRSLNPIDMNDAPLFRAYLFRLDAEDHVLLLVLHDIIIDGWSMVIFMEELSDVRWLYGQPECGRVKWPYP
jgi:Condensation domain